MKIRKISDKNEILIEDLSIVKCPYLECNSKDGQGTCNLIITDIEAKRLKEALQELK
jgi:hypothetical protein